MSRRPLAYRLADEGPFHMAVAVGFEPTVGCPTNAFEAFSFGRSDTPPRRRLPEPGGRIEIPPARPHQRNDQLPEPIRYVVSPSAVPSSSARAPFGPVTS